MNKVFINGKALEVNTFAISSEGDDIVVSITTGDSAEIASAVSDIPAAAPARTSRKLDLNYKNFDLFLTSLFCSLNAPSHLDGYRYLRRSIELAMKDPQMVTSGLLKNHFIFARELLKNQKNTSW